METNILKNKRGQFMVWFFIIAILFTMSIFLLVLNKTYGEIEQPLARGLQSALPEGSSYNVSYTLNQTNGATQLFDSLLPFLLIGVIAFIIMSGAVFRSPIMVIIGIILLAVLILLAVIYSNVYQEISGADSFESTSDDLVISALFMRYLPILVGVATLSIILFMLFKGSGGGGGL